MTECDVWVAAGIYYPTDGTSRDATFQLISGIGLYGGFAGTESTLDERNIEMNETILSGDIDRDGILDEENVYHVVTGADDSILDGFTITSGNADHPDMDDIQGYAGGMLNDGVSPTVVNCLFTRNQASRGAGMGNRNGASPKVINCSFSRNVVTRYGGGGMHNLSSSPTVTGCIFSNNNSQSSGAGMSNYDESFPIVTNCIFSDNSTNRHCGGGMANGSSSSPTVTNCTFFGNEARNFGGGMANEISCSPRVTNCTFSDNRASNGLAMFNRDGSSPIIVNSIFWENTAPSENQIHNSDSGSIPIITYSDICGGYEGEGNLDINPLFADSLKLREDSPCIDVGDNSAITEEMTTDLDDNPRIVDGNGDSLEIVDMGAYEFDPSL